MRIGRLLRILRAYPQDEQNCIVSEVQKLINPVMQSIFDKDMVGNTAYKNPMVRHYFRQVMGV